MYSAGHCMWQQWIRQNIFLAEAQHFLGGVKVKLSGSYVCQLWQKHGCQRALVHTMYHTWGGWWKNDRLHPSQSERDPAETANREIWLATVHCACIHTCFSARDPLKQGGDHWGFASPNSCLVSFPSFSSVAKHQTLHHVPVWLSILLIKHRTGLPAFPSFPSPLCLRQTVRRQPHANSSLNAPQGDQPCVLEKWVAPTGGKIYSRQEVGGGGNDMIKSQTQLPSFPPLSFLKHQCTARSKDS